jgi:formate dehydrogenase iron-sulfur subunit
MIAEGKGPVCADTCMTNALEYGPYNEMVAKANARLAVVQRQYPAANVYGTTQQGGLGVLMILRTAPGDFELP